MPLYEKKIEAQLDVPLAALRSEVPTDPKWGVKKNSEGKNVFWFGYKAHLIVGTSSQYILDSLFSSLKTVGRQAVRIMKFIQLSSF